MDVIPVVHTVGLGDECRVLVSRAISSPGAGRHDWPTFEAIEEWQRVTPGCVLFEVRSGSASQTLDRISRIRNRHPELFLLGLCELSDVRSAVEFMKAGTHNVLERAASSASLNSAIRQGMQWSQQFWSRYGEHVLFARHLRHLTVDEWQVLERLLRGMPNKATASELHCSVRTIEQRRQRVLMKAAATSQAELVRLTTECQTLFPGLILSCQCRVDTSHSGLSQPSRLPPMAGRTDAFSAFDRFCEVLS